MNDPLTKLLEIAGATTQEKDECYLFVFGERGVGKSTFIQALSKENESRLSPPTYGYSYTVITFQSIVTVHIYEINNIESKNSLIKKLLSKNPSKSTCLFVCRPTSPASVENMLQKYFYPIINGYLSEYNGTDMQADLEKYYSTLIPEENSDRKVEITKHTYIPFFIAGSCGPQFPEPDSKLYSSIMYNLRNSALQFGAGVVLSTSNDILTLVASCALRKQLTKEYVNLHPEFILPSYDSKAEIEKLEHEEIVEKDLSQTKAEEKTVQNWQTFLQELVDTTQQTQAKPAKEDDFLSQFE